MHEWYMRIQDVFSSLIDVLLPRRAHTTRTLARTQTDIPLVPASHHLLGMEIITLMDYRDSVVRDLIHSLKYDGVWHSAHVCATVLADFLYEEIAQEKAFSPREILLVPMPLHCTRKRSRGFNQIEIVLDHLPKELRDGTQAALATHLLARTKATRQQAHLARTERIENMRDAFDIPSGTDIKKSHIFLIDDVTTTGATLASAVKTLRKAGAKVTPIALARA